MLCVGVILMRQPSGASQPGFRRGTRIVLKAMIVLSMLSVLLVPSSVYLRRVSSQMAVSDAMDCVTLAINDAIYSEMAEGLFDYEYFERLEKDESGRITAVITNMARINTLSAQLLRDVVRSADGGKIEIRVPLGNLIGSNLLHGRGPDIPVEIIILTSSSAAFRNEIRSAGINQTRHQILLDIRVDIDVMIPWDTISTCVTSEVLVAETVIVGEVPRFYLDDSGE